MTGDLAAPVNASASIDQWIQSCLTLTESQLDQVLPKHQQIPSALHDGMRYAVLDGGKRIRPLLCFAAAQLVRADLLVAARVACAVELIHAYSLVHDDLPCMDNDLLRRGKPTVHVAFGEANAMLVGDGLQALAFSVLADLANSELVNSDLANSDLATVDIKANRPTVAPHAVVDLVAQLAQAAGSLGMVGGQAIDCAMTGTVLSRSDLEQMHSMKTGALLRAAVMMGAHCGNEKPNGDLLKALDQYSRAIGLAFQVIDDVLDVSGDTATLGKTAGKDAQQNKPTFVSLMGLHEAQAFADSLYNQALSSLAPYGEAAQRLRDLALKIVSRKS